ncbi:MAG: hypothetical protein AB1673_11350 [Actinomycetota bacterium]
MADPQVEKARKKLDDEFEQFRRRLDKVRNAFADVEKAGPEDDVSGLLEELEKAVNDARTGGLLGSGAHGHRRALDAYRKLTERF